MSSCAAILLFLALFVYGPLKGVEGAIPFRYNLFRMAPKLSDHFTFRKILRITIAPILMMIFTSLYTIVDGIFISNFAGADAFAGINLAWPLIMIIGGIGFMFGSGGTALVSKLLGEKKEMEANKVFSLIVYSVIVIGLLFSALGFFLVRPFASAMAKISNEATAEMVEQATTYGRLLMLGQCMFMVQNVFQSFFVAAERPGTGFLFTLGAGLTNMVLDALLIAVAGLGVVGAAIATISGYIVGGVGPLLFFIFNKKLPIHLGRTSFMIEPLMKSMTNGISEFVSNMSSSIVATVYNAQMLRYFGPEGVSTYGVVAYVSFVFIAIFIGYCIGMAPVVGYHYGAQNKQELQSVLKKSFLIIGIAGVVMFGSCVALSTPLARLFSSGSESLFRLAEKAIRVYSFTYLLCGFTIFLSSFFTALNNGGVSGAISFVRTLVFQVGAVLLLPLLMGGDGILWSGTFAEIFAFALSFVFLFSLSGRYGYLPINARQEE